MFPIPRHPPRKASGFSLIEIMVGMAIAMIGIIVMMQVFSFSEGNKRITTGGDDAQNNGIVALNGLQRDLRHSGLGFSDISLLGCAIELRAGVVIPVLAPVMINPADPATGVAIIPAGDANTDTLLVFYGSSPGSPQGDVIISQDRTLFNYKPRTPTSYAAGEQLVAAPRLRPAQCTFASGNFLRVETIRTITPAPPTAPLQLNMATTVDVGSKVNGTLYNLGQAPTVAAYAIRNGNLTVCDFMVRNCGDAAKTGDSTFWVPIASNIVSMRAQYGRDTLTPVVAVPLDTATYAVNLYDQTTPATACGWVKTPAVRLAVVARSGQYDRDVVTASAPVWAASAADNPAGSAAAPIDLSKKPDGSANPDWQHYRYKTFQTVVPLRNITWMGAQPLC